MSASFGLVDRKVMHLSMEVQELSLEHLVKRLRRKRLGAPEEEALGASKDRLALAFAPKVAATVHLKLRGEAEESRDTELDALLVDSRKALENGNGKRASEATVEITSRPAAEPMRDEE